MATPLRVLVACEYSGTVRGAFRALGHHAVSCDLLPTDAPGPHHQGDVIDLVVSEGDADADDAGRVILRDCDLHADPTEAPRLRAVVTGGPNNL